MAIDIGRRCCRTNITAPATTSTASTKPTTTRPSVTPKPDTVALEPDDGAIVTARPRTQPATAPTTTPKPVAIPARRLVSCFCGCACVSPAIVFDLPLPLSGHVGPVLKGKIGPHGPPRYRSKVRRGHAARVLPARKRSAVDAVDEVDTGCERA